MIKIKNENFFASFYHVNDPGRIIVIETDGKIALKKRYCKDRLMETKTMTPANALKEARALERTHNVLKFFNGSDLKIGWPNIDGQPIKVFGKAINPRLKALRDAMASLKAKK